MIEDPIEAAEALIAGGRAEEAARALRARLDAGRGGLLARLTLVKALMAAGDTTEALAQAREAVSLHPNVAPAVLALGEALLAAELLPTAIAELQRSLRLDPDQPRARELIAVGWLKAGEADKALVSLRGLDNPPALLVAAAEAIKKAPRSDPGYVRHLFDQFSADYDSRMIGQLGYAAPQILLDLAAMVMPGRHDLSILDLGCGTGLAGVAFKPLAGIERGKLEVIQGADTLLVWGDDDRNHTRCGICGSLLYSVVRDGEYVHVALGSLEEEPTIRPTKHIWVGSKAPWYEITDDLVQHQEY